MFHRARLPMHELFRADDLAAERRADGRVPQAGPEHGTLPRKMPDDFDGYSRLLRRARPRRDHDVRGREPLDLLRCRLVVAADFDLLSQLAKVLDEVVGERIVVVEDEDHSDQWPVVSGHWSAKSSIGR